MNEQLKPCPFCGGRELSLEHNRLGDAEAMYTNIPPKYWVSCKGCGTDGGMRETQKDAISAWNKRVKEVSE